MTPNSGTRPVLTSVLWYAVLGPVFGSALVSVVGLVAALASPNTGDANPGATILAIVPMFLIGIPFGFWFGGLQAALVGLVTGIAEMKWGRAPIWVPILAAAIAWFLFAVLCILPETEQGRGSLANINAMIWLAIHAVPAACVWWTRTWWRNKRRA